MMGNAIEMFGAIDILVNNAGIQFVAPIDEFPSPSGTRSSRSI
jgi:3-hydroxybutyrate dehydrogenase